MYKSPVELITKEMNTQIEEDIFNAIQEVAVDVDKEELIKALQYDRNQYEQGYIDGKLSNQWISINDRLPDESGAYLCYCGESFIKTMNIYSFAKNLKQVDKYDFRENKVGWYFYDSDWGFCERTGITHWMPLPEPPTEKEI